MASSKQIEYKADPNKFDMITHRWDNQGNLVSKNLYRTYIIEGNQYFERPVNSGNLWFENNQPAGRVELTFGDNGKIADSRFDFKAEHKEYTAPKSANEQLHYELEQAKDRTAQLEAELAQIKKERKPPMPTATKAADAVPTLTKKEA